MVYVLRGCTDDPDVAQGVNENLADGYEAALQANTFGSQGPPRREKATALGTIPGFYAS